METKKAPLSIRIIYWVTNITFWIYVVSAIMALAIAFIFMFKIFDKPQLHVGLPTAINILEQGSVVLNETTMQVEFKEMYGKVHFIDTPGFIGQIYSVFILMITALFFYIFYTFKKFIKNVYQGLYFDINNIALLKRISYAILGGWLFTVIYAYFQYYYLAKNMQFTTLEITGNIETYPSVLIIALFLWVLSHIFMKGCQLQEESNYTI